MRHKNITGLRFGKLTVLDFKGNNKSGVAMWLCACDCGKHKTIMGTSLRAGRSKSCGCTSQFTTKRAKTHGMSHSRVYRIWNSMRGRCSEKSKGPERKNYYERGIRVCTRWEKFENFLADMGEPARELSLDRIDNSKGYAKDNCRWATKKEQANNTRSNVIVEINGQKMTLSELACLLHVKPNTLLYSIKRNQQNVLNKTIGRVAG